MKYSIEYTDNIEDGFGGYTEYPSLIGRVLGKNPVVKIRLKYKDDKGLLNHETKHVEQYYRHWYHGLWYSINKEYRYKCELEAYKEQIMVYKYDKGECTWIIDALQNKYNLNKERGEIIEDVLKILMESKVQCGS